MQFANLGCVREHQQSNGELTSYCKLSETFEMTIEIILHLANGFTKIQTLRPIEIPEISYTDDQIQSDFRFLEVEKKRK